MLLGVERGKTTLLAAVFGAFLLVGSVAPIVARDRNDECRERIHKAEAKLRRAIERHGEQSRQAQKRRYELERARERCGRDRDRDHDHR
ncbi:MAG: hypothetical protein ABSA70_01555 [Terriglobia bacterium]